MKRLLAFVLILAMLLSMTACDLISFHRKEEEEAGNTVSTQSPNVAPMPTFTPSEPPVTEPAMSNENENIFIEGMYVDLSYVDSNDRSEEHTLNSSHHA